MLKEFREFATRGNVIDLAVGLILGAAFKDIVNSLVKDVIMPPVGAIVGGVDFEHLFISLSDVQYATLAEAQAAGAATLNYGRFLTVIIDFVIIAFSMFILVRTINRLMRELEDATEQTEQA